MKPIINKVLKDGKDGSYKSLPTKYMEINGRIVEIPYVNVNGKMKISNGWVR